MGIIKNGRKERNGIRMEMQGKGKKQWKKVWGKKQWWFYEGGTKGDGIVKRVMGGTEEV